MRARATIRFHNAAMIDARHAIGLTVERLAKRCGVSIQRIYELQRFKMPKSMNPWIVRVATVLGVPVDDLWQDDVAAAGPPVKITHDFQLDRLLAMKERRALPSGEDAACGAESKAMLDKMLDGLTFREREVLKMRYGLDGEPPLPLIDIAKAFKVCRERVRAIESKALRRMRIGERSALLAESSGDDHHAEIIRRDGRL